MVNFCSRPLFYFSDIFGSLLTTEHGAGAASGTPGRHVHRSADTAVGSPRHGT